MQQRRPLVATASPQCVMRFPACAWRSRCAARQPQQASRYCMEAGDAPDAVRGGGVEGGVAVNMTPSRQANPLVGQVRSACRPP